MHAFRSVGTGYGKDTAKTTFSLSECLEDGPLSTSCRGCILEEDPCFVSLVSSVGEHTSGVSPRVIPIGTL